MSNMVTNAIDQNEASILSEVISLLKQLMPAAPQEEMTEPVMEAMGEDAEMEEVDVTKAVIDETGDTKAEERLSNQTATTDISLQDIKKSLEKMIGKTNKTVQKSQTDPVVTTAISQLTQLMTKVVKNQEAQDQFNQQLVHGLGFSEEIIRKNLPTETTNVVKSKPVQTLDTAAVVQQVLEGVFKNMPQLTQNPAAQHSFNDKRGVNKNMQAITKFIGGVK